LATKSDCSPLDHDITHIHPTPLQGSMRPRSFRMKSCAGRDSVVETIRERGWAAYEPPLPDVFALCVWSSAGAVLDVGANSGFYSLLAASLRPDVKVFAFEPYPPVAMLCAANVALNAANGQISLHRTAICRSSGVAALYVPYDDHGTIEMSASLNPRFRSKHSAVLRVPTVTADLHIEQSGSPVVGIIKADVESAEHEVLRGAERLIQRDRPLIFCEVLPDGRHDLLEALRRRYRLIDVRLQPTSAIIGGPVSFDPKSRNHLLVPAERLTSTLIILESAGLGLRS
jgi:FkbM family methyltransferase